MSLNNEDLHEGYIFGGGGGQSAFVKLKMQLGTLRKLEFLFFYFSIDIFWLDDSGVIDLKYKFQNLAHMYR